MTTELTPGTLLAGYRIESLIGRGAMAEVYRARDGDDCAVALKLLDSTVTHDERFRRRFLRESELATSLRHPHIVAMLGSGEDGDRLFIAMELVEGADLRRLLRDEGRLDPERAVALLEQVAAALDAAHEAGLVHRDVKPGNILVGSDPDGEHAYLCDFGLARHASSVSSLTGDRGFVGTIDYVPPEQIEGGTIDARADVYSLGCVLYECLAGVRPYDHDSELSVVFAHLNEPPPKLTDVRPDLPAAFDEVFATALAKSPDDRYRSCGELAAGARAALHGRVLARRRPRRRRIVAALAVLLAAAGAVAAVLLSDGHGAAPVTITPTSIAGARLGDTDLMLERLWGGAYRKSTMDQPADYSSLIYSARGLSAFFVGTSVKTVEIATSNGGDRTAEGIGPCSSVADLKRVYGKRLRPNPHNVHNGVVYGYLVGKHLFFGVGPLPIPNRVEVVALYSNGTDSASYVAGGPCVPGGQANVVAQSAGVVQPTAAPALTRTFGAKRFKPYISARTPAGWTRGEDTASLFSLRAPHGSTSIEFRLDPSAASPSGLPLSNVSHTANGLSAWLHATPAFNTARPQGSRLGHPALTAVSIDLGSSAHGRPFLTFRSHATLRTGAGRTRLYLTPIRIGTLVHTLVIAVRSASTKEFAAALPAADAIVRSIVVAAVPVQEITALSSQCTQPFGGTCLGELPAGTHTTRSFKPSLTYTIPVGWTNFNDHEGNFGLVPPGGDWSNNALDNGETDRLSVLTRVAPTGSPCGDAAAPVRSAAAYVRWLVNDPALTVTSPKPVTLGSLSGFVVDLRVRPGWTMTCPWSHGQPAAQMIHGVLPSNPDYIDAVLPGKFVMRLYLLDYKHATLAVEIAEVAGSSKLDAYGAFVKTFRFAP